MTKTVMAAPLRGMSQSAENVPDLIGDVARLKDFGRVSRLNCS